MRTFSILFASMVLALSFAYLSGILEAADLEVITNTLNYLNQRQG